MRPSSILLVALTIAAASAAAASTITEAFTVRAVSGALKGATSSGSFTFDRSNITPNATNKATGLLTAFDFTWDGISYDATTVNTGSLTFNAGGTLSGFYFGTNCVPGACSVSSGEEQWLLEYDGNPNAFDYATAGTRIADGVVSAPGVPEPATVSLFLVGLLGAAWRVGQKSERPLRLG